MVNHIIVEKVRDELMVKLYFADFNGMAYEYGRTPAEVLERIDNSSYRIDRDLYKQMVDDLYEVLF